MEDYSFMTKEHSARATQMLNLVDAIEIIYQECLNNADSYSKLKEKRKAQFKNNEIATRSFRAELRNAKKKWIDSRIALDPIIADWNTEMEIYIKRYKYIKLSQYLPDLNFLQTWESRPSKEIATATLIKASSNKIPRLFELNPALDSLKLTNYYPIDWLEKEFNNIYKSLNNDEDIWYNV